MIAALLFWRGRPIRAEIIGAIGAALVVLGAAAPSLLRRPRLWWFRGARIVGDFNARVLLTLMFMVVLLPLGLIWRLTGKDPAHTPPQRQPGMVAVPRTGTAIAATICACIEVDMSKGRVVSEFWQFLRQEKKYWLVPIVVVFVLFGLLIVFSQSSAVAPFIYTLF